MAKLIGLVLLLAGLLFLLLGVNLTRGPSSDTGPSPQYGVPLMLLGLFLLYRGFLLLRPPGAARR